MRAEKGMTMMGMLMGVIVFIVLVILLMKVFPVYLKNYELKSSLAALKKIDPTNFSTDPSLNTEVLKNKLSAQLSINSLDDIKPEYITISQGGSNEYLVRVKYRVIRHLFYNISLLFEFDESEEVYIASS